MPPVDDFIIIIFALVVIVVVVAIASVVVTIVVRNAVNSDQGPGHVAVFLFTQFSARSKVTQMDSLRSP